jgi:hypothetical protein
LGTVATILRAGASFDAQKGADLDTSRVMVLAMNCLGIYGKKYGLFENIK